MNSLGVALRDSRLRDIFVMFARLRTDLGKVNFNSHVGTGVVRPEPAFDRSLTFVKDSGKLKKKNANLFIWLDFTALLILLFYFIIELFYISETISVSKNIGF